MEFSGCYVAKKLSFLIGNNYLTNHMATFY